jgi:cytochrome P450
MSHCPHKTLLHVDNFAHGTPREEIARLRNSGERLVWQEDEYARGGHWLVLQRDDIDTVLKTPADFTNNFGPLLEDFPEDLLAVQQESMTFMDPPRHRQYRSLIDPAFRPKALQAREKLIQHYAKDVIDSVVPRGQCEFVEEVAMQVPMRTILGLLGVEQTDYAYVANLTNVLVLSADPDFAASREEGFQASMELWQFGASLAQSLRDNPRDSISLSLLDTNVDGERMSNEQYAGFFLNLIVGGMETTRNTTAWMMYEFIRHPEQYAMLQADLSLVPGAVEETLRHRNTVVYLRRTATRDMTFGDKTVREGDKLVCLLASPSRNAAYFDDPDTFDITRSPKQIRRHYRTFGAGPHFCVGVHQSRMMLEAITREIAQRINSPRLLSEPLHFKSNFMDGFKRMDIAFEGPAD